MTTTPSKPRSKLPLIVAAAAVLAGVGVGVWFMTRANSKTRPTAGPAANIDELKNEDKAPGSTVTGKLPANFPRDVPQYPGSTVGLASIPAGKPRDGSVRLGTPATIAEIKAYYSTELKAGGWRRTRLDEGDSELTMEFKKDARTLTLRASSGEILLDYRSASTMDLSE